MRQVCPDLYSHGRSLCSMRLSRSIRSATASFAGFPSNRTSLTCSTIGMETLYFFAKRSRSLCGINAFHHHLDFLHGFLHRVSFSDEDPGTAVSAVHACNMSRSGLRSRRVLCKSDIFRPWQRQSSRDLRHSAGDEGRFCIVPVTKTVSDPGRQGNNVLQRCSCLDPQDIRTRVYTEYRTDEGGLDILRDLLLWDPATQSVGSPRLTSSAWLGPERTAVSAIGTPL